MVKAVLRKGILQPLDPLPSDWPEGTEVEVYKVPSQEGNGKYKDRTDEWMDQVEAAAALGDPADDLRLEAAIQAIRRREKALARKKLELG